MAKRALLRTIILSLAAVASVYAGIVIWGALRVRHQQQIARNIAKTQKEEREAAAQQVADRQKNADIAAATKISLTPYSNCDLTNSFIPRNTRKNNLEELPTGTHIFGGIPFEVSGRVQLSGKALASFGADFPKRVDGIKISGKCEKIHLFHGALFANRMGETVAGLVLHYGDGSQKTIEIVTGQHVLDWWGPLYKTGAPDADATVQAAGSELAWVGSNPYIRARKPNLSVRLYKSTFENPLPSVEIATIDYVSSGTFAAPFLVGLTIE